VPIHHWKCDDEAEQHQIHIKMEETGTMILFTNKTYRKYTRYIFFATFSFCQAFQNMFIVLYSLPLPFSAVSH
jgi:hypothetical protein